jgi:PAS domain S-box-containing protein
MEKKNQSSTKSLRQQAEEILKSRFPITVLPKTEAETLALIHELQVNKIELELQNRELIHSKGLNTAFKNNQKKILDLIDFEKVNSLLEGFNQSTGFVTAILDLDGNVLSKSGWRQICTGFHRIHPETARKCLISDTELANKMADGENYHFYQCLNGLVDVAVPIVINGEHIANLFSGQFFFEEPDESFFQKQATKYGFNKETYLKAFNEVPIISKEKVRVAMDFLLEMTQLISEITYQKLEQIQLNEALRKSEERSRNVLNNLLEGCQIIGFDWKYIYLNKTAEIHNRRPNNELIGNRYMDMWPGVEETEVFKIIKRTLETRIPDHFENVFIFPDGSSGWFDLSIQAVPEGVFILSIDITERKKAENNLRVSEEKYRLIANNSNDWIYWVAPDGQLLYVSPACEKLTGYTPEEFINCPKLNQDIVFDADREKLDKHHNFPKSDNTSHELEYRIITKAGEFRWISHSCSPIFSSDGEYLGRRGTNRNITDRKLQEEQLYESEFRFTNLYEKGPFGMVMADNEFRFKKANSAFCSIMGYSESEIQQFTFKDVTHPDDLVNDLPNIMRLMNKEISVYKTEKRYIRKDGQMIWGSLTVTATYDRDGQFLYNLGIIEDITRRKQAEKALQETSIRLNMALNSSNSGVWDWDILTNSIIWSTQMYKLFGIDEHEVKASFDTWRSVLHPDDLELAEFKIEEALKNHTGLQNDYRVVLSDGTIQWIYATGEGYYDENGQPIRMIGICQDITDRKRAEEQLMKTRNQLEKIFVTSPGIVCTSQLRPDGTVCFPYGGERLANYFGIPTAHLEEDATPYFALIHPDDFKSLLASIEESAIQMTPWRYEWRMVHPEKGVMWIEGHSMPVREADGSTLWHGVATDITERKRAEEKISELNERIATATLSAKVGIWDWDIANDYLVWDDQMYALYGLKLGDFPGAYEAWLQGIHPEDRDFSNSASQQAVRGEKEYDTEFRVVWPDKSVHYLKAAGKVFFDKNKNAIRMLGVNFDITKQKLTENELKESEEYLKLGYETANLGIWKNDMQTMAVEFDEQARIHYGFDESIVTLSDVIARIHPDDMGRLVAEIEKATSPSGTGRYATEYRVIHPDGSVHWLYIGVRVIFEGEGENRRSIMGFGTSLDITERKHAEERILELNNELEQRVKERTSQLEAANKELEAFSYSVSHDLRAPLRHINGFVDLLNANYKDILPDKGKHYLTVINDASTQMGALIDDLLQFSRTNRQEMQQMNLNMNSIIQEVLKFFNEETKDRKIDWDIAKLPVITGDLALLRMVWVNLFSNAVKFTRNKEIAKINIGYTEEKKEYIFYIRDNGAGFDMRYVHKLFGVFQRLHSKQEFEGTGIGLANVQRIVQRHGGRIWAESKLDEGATFYFTIPKAKENLK